LSCGWFRAITSLALPRKRTSSAQRRQREQRNSPAWPCQTAARDLGCYMEVESRGCTSCLVAPCFPLNTDGTRAVGNGNSSGSGSSSSGSRCPGLVPSACSVYRHRYLWRFNMPRLYRSLSLYEETERDLSPPSHLLLPVEVMQKLGEIRLPLQVLIDDHANLLLLRDHNCQPVFHLCSPKPSRSVPLQEGEQSSFAVKFARTRIPQKCWRLLCTAAAAAAAAVSASP